MISLPHITIWSLLICISLSICRLSCAWQQQPLPSSSTSSRNNKGRGTNLFSIRDGVNANANNGVIDDGRTRRSFFEDCSSKAAGALLTTSAFGALFSPERANAAADEEELIDVYFGCGCFWHVQHEFVEAEKSILGRSDNKVTSRAGYAGGNLGMKDGKVCYHNLAMVSDYGKLGHAEIVSLRIPSSKFKDFAIEYCKLFKNGLRPDQAGDRGLEYRNVVGFKGGSKNADLAAQLIEASKETGDALDFSVGKGSDRDIPSMVWIMDTEKYPSYVAEQYHQFHDGFNFGENYPGSYNNLGGQFAKDGEDFGSCPRM